MTFKNFQAEDIIAETTAKVITAGAFAGNTGSVGTFFTSSTQPETASYLDIYSINPASDATQTPDFSIAYGDYYGSGSVQYTAHSDDTITRSKIIYSQFLNLITGGTSEKLTLSASATNDRFLAIVFNSGKYHEKLNVGNIELHLGDGSNVLRLIDDYSNDQDGFQTNNLLTYKLVSGSGTSIFNASNPVEYGRVYPQIGAILLDAPAVAAHLTSWPIFSGSSEGNNVRRFKDVLQSGSYFRARSEEQIKTTIHFCQVRPHEFNFSNNPSFTTGSSGGGQLRHSEMQGDPTTYITTIGLYNEQNELIAVANLSRPIRKNFTTSAEFRVQLDY